jgi:cyanophycinase
LDQDHIILGKDEMKKTPVFLALLILVLSFSAYSAPKGHLFIIGGGDRPESMMKRFVALAQQVGSGKIVVFPMASSGPNEVGPGLVEEFKKLGANAEFHILTREQALKEDSSRILDDAGGVYFSGGDQSRQTAILLNTPIHKKLLEIYEKGAVMGGSSAGAAVMSEVMITGDERREVKEGREFETLLAGIVVTAPGFGFIKTAIVDQHFATRKRHNRLISLVAENPKLLGIGIDESTAIIVNPDDTFDVIGVKNVVIYDASRAKIKMAPSKAIGISNMVLHVLLPGSRYSLSKRKIVTP